MDKVAGFFKNVNTIYATFMIIAVAMYNGIIWAADQRYITITSYQANEIKNEVSRLNLKIAELKIRKRYANSDRERDMLESLIINIEAQIKNLKGE